MDIAAAAIKQTAGEPVKNEPEIPTAATHKEKHPAREREAVRKERKLEKVAKEGPKAKRPTPGWEVAKLYVGAGRKLKIRPGDLVGAITNELGLDSSAIGAITIWDRHSIVEVPANMADTIVAGLNATTIKGKKLQVRRDRAG
jgi:ATP-dependent RNA helicase DeaD